MERSQFVDLYPRLYHMAVAGSWPSVEMHGLLTTQELVSTAGLPPADQDRILTQRRRTSIRVEHRRMGTIIVRDQLPLRPEFLEPKLVDMSIQDWIATLNGRVFFWPTHEKLTRLLNARQYRSAEQDVITVDTRSLLESYATRVELSPINSGAALYPNASLRGRSTFAPIEEYDYNARKRARGAADAVVEVAVVGGVPDVARHVIEVRRWRGSELLSIIR